MGQPRASFDCHSREGEDAACREFSLQDSLLAMEKQCHPPPCCLRCMPDIQTLGCDSGGCSVALPSSILSQKDRGLQDRQQVSRACCVPVLCVCREWGLGADHLDLLWHLLHLAPCTLAKPEGLVGLPDGGGGAGALQGSIRDLVWVMPWLHQWQRRAHSSPMHG